MIGEFEYLLLAATHRLSGDAYGASIAQEIEQATGRRCSLGSPYTTLDRLESNGLGTRMGEPTPEAVAVEPSEWIQTYAIREESRRPPLQNYHDSNGRNSMGDSGYT